MRASSFPIGAILLVAVGGIVYRKVFHNGTAYGCFFDRIQRIRRAEQKARPGSELQKSLRPNSITVAARVAAVGRRMAHRIGTEERNLEQAIRVLYKSLVKEKTP